MHSSIDGGGIDSEMKLQDSQDEKTSIDLERYRNLVRTFIDLVSVEMQNIRFISLQLSINKMLSMIF